MKIISRIVIIFFIFKSPFIFAVISESHEYDRCIFSNENDTRNINHASNTLDSLKIKEVTGSYNLDSTSISYTEDTSKEKSRSMHIEQPHRINDIETSLTSLSLITTDNINNNPLTAGESFNHNATNFPDLKQTGCNVFSGRKYESSVYTSETLINNISNSVNSSIIFPALVVSAITKLPSVNDRKTSRYMDSKLARGVNYSISLTEKERNDIIFEDYVEGNNNEGYQYIKEWYLPKTLEITTFIIQKNTSLLFIACGNTIETYNIIDNKQYTFKSPYRHRSHITSMIMLTNDQLATSSFDRTIKVWRFHKDLRRLEYMQTLEDHKDWVNSVIDLSENILASASNDNTIKIWQLNNEKQYICTETLTFLQRDMRCAVSSVIPASFNRLVATSDRGLIKVWQFDENTGKYAYQQTMRSSTASWIKSVVEVSDNQIVTGSINGMIDVWKWSSLTGKYTFFDSFKGHKYDVTSLIKTNNGCLVSASTDQTIKIWKQNKHGKYICINTLRPNYHSQYFQMNSYFHTVCEDDNETLISLSGNKIKKWKIKDRYNDCNDSRESQ